MNKFVIDRDVRYLEGSSFGRWYHVYSQAEKTKLLKSIYQNALSGLKKQVNDEKNARAMLESNIASDKEELVKSQEEGTVKKGKVSVE